MRYSDNYNLKLPQRGVDRANVDDLDDNFEIIDGALADDRQISLLMYDSTSTYNTGDIRGYENPTTHRIRAYRCLEDNVTGPWDATKWAQTTLADEIGTGGGASSLADLTDTDITSPTNGQTLKYNSTSGKWENASGGAVSDLDDLGDVDITTPSDGDLLTYDAQNDEWVNAPASVPDLGDLGDVTLTTPSDGQTLTYDDGEWVNKDLPAVTKTATGNPIEINDGAAAPLIKCVTQITGYQSGTGTPSPDNIRPITAYTEGKIEVRGKNLCNKADFNTTEPLVYKPMYVGEGTFTMSTNCPQTPGTVYKDIFILGGNVDTGADSSLNGVTSTTPITVTAVDGYITIASRYNSARNNPADYDWMLVKGSEVADYEPYIAPTTHTTTYPSAIYRGSEDVVNGKVTSEWLKEVFDGSSDEDWGLQGINSYGIANFQHYMNTSGSAYEKGFITNYLPAQNTLAGITQTEGFLTNISLLYVRISATKASTVEEFRTFLSNHPLELAYEPGPPTTTPVTPTNLPIKSLNGYSHIESSTGDLEVEYITGKYQPIVDLISESSGGDSQHHYSTDEQVVGTWIDGKTLYERTITFTTTSSASTYTRVAHNISDVDTIFIENGFVYNESTHGSRKLSGYPTNIDPEIFAGIVDSTYFDYKVGSNQTSKTAYVTLRYTKTSTRSLSKNTEKTSLEPISEPLTDKTDNLSKDEIELKEEDESKEKEEITEEPEEEPTDVTEEEPVDPEPSKEEEADER